MVRRLIDYLPPVLRELKEYKRLADTEEPELSILWDAIGGALDDQFPATATIDGIRRWEQLLGIVPKATEEVYERRLRLLSRIGERLPFTIRALRNMLDAVYGDGVCEISVDYEKYVLNCAVEGASTANIRAELYGFLRRIVPANLPLLLCLRAELCITVSVTGGGYFANIPMTGVHLTGTKPQRYLSPYYLESGTTPFLSAGAFYYKVPRCGTRITA